MVFLIILLAVVYILIGSFLGGYYYYIVCKEWKNNGHYGSPDLDDMCGLPVWIACFWVLIAPITFAIYFAKKKAESEDDEK